MRSLELVRQVPLAAPDPRGPLGLAGNRPHHHGGLPDGLPELRVPLLLRAEAELHLPALLPEVRLGPAGIVLHLLREPTIVPVFQPAYPARQLHGSFGR